MDAGWITIGTELSTDKFDKQIKGLEDKIKKEEQKAQVKIGVKETQERELERTTQKIDKLTTEYNKLLRLKKLYNEADKKEAMAEIGTKEFRLANRDKLDLGKALGADDLGNFTKVQKMEESIVLAKMKQEALQDKIRETEQSYQGIVDKVQEYKRQINAVNLKKQKQDIDQIKNGFDKVGSTIQNVTRKVGVLALGIFGVRTAFSLLQRASSSLANYDKQYAANLEYIKYALTQAIAPVLQYIVNLAATLLGYINAIVNALFGINLFSKASANDFNKMKAGASGAAKAAKEIRKQLAGFDEINMLNDQSDTGGGGGAGGTTPSFDLSALGGEVPDWLKWIVDHKDEILAVIAGVTAGLAAWKLGFSALQSLGIGVAIGGIVYAIEKLIAFMGDPSFENFGGTIQGIGIAITGLAIAFGGLYSIVAGVVVLLVGTFLKYWDKIRDTLQNGINWLKDKVDWVSTMFGSTIGEIYETGVNALQNLLDFFDKMFTSIKGQFEGIIMFLQGVFTGDWNKAWEGIKKGFTEWWNGVTGMIKSLWSYFNNILIEPLKIAFSSLWNGIINGFKGAIDWIQRRFNDMISFFNRIISVINGLFANLGTKAGNIIGANLKAVVNVVLGVIERVLNNPIRAINSLIGTINTLPGVNLSRLSTFSLPRLAVGGIVNVPNKGTVIGGAIAGESGREGVLPLTDSQAMAELGREIGKNVLINLTNITQMNARVIGRELKQVQNEQNFAYNT